MALYISGGGASGLVERPASEDEVEEEVAEPSAHEASAAPASKPATPLAPSAPAPAPPPSVHMALSDVRPDIHPGPLVRPMHLSPLDAPAAAAAAAAPATPTPRPAPPAASYPLYGRRGVVEERDGMLLERGDHSVVLMPARARSVAASSILSAASQRLAHSNRSVLNTNDTERHPRSVVLNVDGDGDVLQAQLRRVEASLKAAAQNSAHRRKAEDAALSMLQPRAWDAMVEVALDAVLSAAHMTREALGWDVAMSGARCTQRLRATIADLAAFCSRQHSGVGATQVSLAGAQATMHLPLQPAAKGDLAAHVRSLAVALNQRATLRRSRLEAFLANCEAAYRDMGVVACAAVARAWSAHCALRTAVEDMTARLRAAHEHYTQQSGGAQSSQLDDPVLAQRVASLVDDAALSQRTSSTEVAHDLRREADMLHNRIQILLRRQLQKVKDKGQLLAHAAAARRGGGATTQAIVDADAEIAALGRAIDAADEKRQRVEAMWRTCLRQGAAVGVGPNGGAAAHEASDAQELQHAVRARTEALSLAKAAQQRKEAAKIATVTRGLLEKLATESEEAARAIFIELATTLKEARATLEARVEARRAAFDVEVLRKDDAARVQCEALAREVSVRGGAANVRQLQNASATMVAQHMTQQVTQHLRHFDDVVDQAPAHLRRLMAQPPPPQERR